ncbi:MAG TPA: hypothetical protein VN837_17900 [Chloroflexota bacterium]|nr:hypothetical protein [Chloroflexota bacterium]
MFNAGEHVEGYSNLLWTLLLAIPLRLHISVDTFAILVGAFFGILAVHDSWRVCRQIGVGFWWSAAAIVPLALNPDYWLSVTNGLEGGLFSFLLMRTVYLVVSRRRLAMAGLCGGLLFMTRPEGLLVIPLCAIYLSAPERIDARTTWMPNPRKVLLLLLPWLSVVACVTLWRLLYYEAWLPNTVTAKAPPHHWSVYLANIQAGIQYWETFLQAAMPFVLGALAAVALGWRRPVVFLCLALVAIEVPTVLVNGGDWMPHFRLIIVFLPLLAVLLGVALEELARQPRHFPLLWLVLVWSVRAILLVEVLAALPYHGWNQAPRFQIGETEPCYQDIARAILPRMNATDRTSSEVLGEFSTILIANYSHDLQGLTDSYVAHHGTTYNPRFGTADFPYTYQKIRPEIIVVHDVTLITGLVAIAHGGYTKRYATFLFPTLPGCASRPVWVSLSRNVESRILPALTPFHPQVVTTFPSG